MSLMEMEVQSIKYAINYNFTYNKTHVINKNISMLHLIVFTEWEPLVEQQNNSREYGVK